MALSVTQANTVSKDVYNKDYSENVYDSHPFLKTLKDKKKVIVAGGDQITFPVQYKSLGTGDAVDWGDQVNFESVDTLTQAVLDWAPYRAHTMLTWEERSKNQAGPQQIVNLIKNKHKQLEAEMAFRVATDIWATSAVSGRITPIATIVDADDSYAGIAVADATVWAGNEDTSSTTLTRALLYEDVVTSEFADGKPNAHYTTRALLAAYNSLLGADERYQNTKDANAGFTTLTLYGDPVYSDSYIAAGDWFGLDMDAFELHMMKGENMAVSDWEDLHVAGYPKSLSKIATCVTNLVCYRRRTSFKLTALTGI